ncbi:MAG: rhomboid family intramembrane serine protease [Phycisphaerae bacterium]|nr:rhomboid family intramembrane serine protease [Phycisphaerae bacterium]
MFIPISTDTSIRRTPWVNYGLVTANLIAFLLTQASHTGGRHTEPSTLAVWLGGGVLDGQSPELYQFFTYQFLHANFAHIAGNMLFLWVFGNAVNAKMGHAPYLLFYLAGGVFAATAYGFGNDQALIGASGSIAAVTGAYLALFPRSHITVLYWFIVIGTFELPSMLMIVFKLILWDNIMAPKMVGGSNVAFGAHLAGYFFGFLALVFMLWLHAMPRDQFDVVALWRRWLQRQAMATAMGDPNAQARAQYGRVARPVSVDAVAGPHGEPVIVSDPIVTLRSEITDALDRNERDAAASLYEKLMEIDPRQVLPRQQQLDIGNQLCFSGRLPQAAATYEKFLNQYPTAQEADQVRLLLGIIYVRDLHQYEIAEGHLAKVLGRLPDAKHDEKCRYWLNVALTSLGKPGLGTA